MSQDCRINDDYKEAFCCDWCDFYTGDYEEYTEHECDIDEEEKEDESK